MHPEELGDIPRSYIGKGAEAAESGRGFTQRLSMGRLSHHPVGMYRPDDGADLHRLEGLPSVTPCLSSRSSMGSHAELEAMAKRILDDNRYMTIATADETGRPWATPVYFTPDEYKRLYWVSSPDARHSRNLQRRPEVGIVVFDSQVRIGAAEAVYISAHAREVADPTAEICSVAFRRRFEALKAFLPEELRHPARLRLFEATATEHYVLIRGSDPVWGKGVDARVEVSLA